MSRAVVTMYFGVEEARAEMPSSAKWIVLCFGGWRLLADIVLTAADFCSGKSCTCQMLALHVHVRCLRCIEILKNTALKLSRNVNSCVLLMC